MTLLASKVPIWKRCRRSAALLAITVPLCLAAAACEGPPPQDVELTIRVETDETIYVVRKATTETFEMALRRGGIDGPRATRDNPAVFGVAGNDGEPGGCFGTGIVLAQSRTGTLWHTLPPDEIDIGAVIADLQIVDEIGHTCTDESTYEHVYSP